MKVMMFVKTTPELEAGMPFVDEPHVAMNMINDELVKAGIRLDVGGLRPSKMGARIDFNGNKVTVTDGPFAESKDIVAGFWVWEVRSMEEAITWAKRCPYPEHSAGVLEVRPFWE